ncbi:predicted protein [Anaerostipes caccae]|nr:predicted protein [Anaerostipes caccae]
MHLLFRSYPGQKVILFYEKNGEKAGNNRNSLDLMKPGRYNSLQTVLKKEG